MVKFKSEYVNGSESVQLGKFSNIDSAIEACIEHLDDYCLDSPQSRRESLRKNHFCVVGCGPNKFIIHEVKE